VTNIQSSWGRLWCFFKYSFVSWGILIANHLFDWAIKVAGRLVTHELVFCTQPAPAPESSCTTYSRMMVKDLREIT
jgi:hypothetical protein